MTEHMGSEPRPSRRHFLGGAAAGLVAGGLAGWAAGRLHHRTPPAPPAQPQPPQATTPLALPGLFPGRVIEVHHPKAVDTNNRNAKGYSKRDRRAVKDMIARGMTALVGCQEPVEAWRVFFSPGDRVGIKVVPVGQPDSISSHEVVLEIIDALVAAGVRTNDILVFERYKHEFMECGYHEMLPEGVHWECCSYRYDDLQLEITGQLPGQPFQDHVAGYDPDIFRQLDYCQPQHDPRDDRRFRSHLSLIVSKRLDKFISIPVLKDHRSSGVTLSLKNLSHGLVNNVARSHIIYPGRKRDEPGATLNQCGTFIPAIASLPAIREKAVLQILDGLVGTWEGGPHTGNKTFATWPYGSLFFATDPVALDRIGWEIIDQKRQAEGWPGVAQMGLDARTGVGQVDGKPYPELLHIRQPQHIPLAQTLGLGIFERGKIEHRRIDLG